jgi:hypothetical protein
LPLVSAPRRGRSPAPARRAAADLEGAALHGADLDAESERGPSNLLSISRARILVWATPRGDRVAYEVSKAVNAPLQALCKTAPLCPGETPGDGLPGWIQPNGVPLGACPYEYETRGACISDRNIEALVAALFSPTESRLLGNYLNAMGYIVREEEFPPESLDGTRILNAHARIGNSHEVRVMGAPGVGEIVLVREIVLARDLSG